MPDPTQDQQIIPKPFLPMAGQVTPPQPDQPAQPMLPRAGTQAPAASNTQGAPSAASPPARQPVYVKTPGATPQAELTREQQNGPGYNQIKNPFLRGLAKAGSTIAGLAVPRIAPNIPGTEAHHQQVLAQAGNAVKQEQGAQTAADESKLRQAQTGEAGATEAHTEAETENLKNPQGQPKTEEFFKAGDGSYIGYRDANGKIYGPQDKDLPPGVRAVLEAGKPKPTKASNTFEAWRETPGNENKDPLEFVKANAEAEQAAKPKPKEAPEQQFLDEYRTQHPGSSVADAEKAFKQLVPKEPVDRGQNFVAGGKLIRVEPGGAVPEGAQTAAGVNTANTPTTTQRTAAGRAEIVHEQMPEVLARIDAMKDKLGPVAGRWNDFMQGRVGTDNPDFAALRSDLLMMSSAVALAHAQGRLPENLREEFDRAINAPKQTAENLKAVLGRVDDWMGKVAEQGGKGAKTGAAPARPKGVPDNAVWDAATQHWKAP